MDSPELSDVAWDLVEHCRPTLTVAELNTAFVRLGVGDYREAIVVALKSVVRAAGPPLPDGLHRSLTHLLQVYYFDQDFVDLLALVPRT